MRYVCLSSLVCLFAVSCGQVEYRPYPGPRHRDNPPTGRRDPTTGTPDPAPRPKPEPRGVPYHLIEKCIEQLEPYKYSPEQLAAFGTNHPPYARRVVDDVEIVYHKPFAFVPHKPRPHRRRADSRLAFIDRKGDLRVTIRFLESARRVLGVDVSDYRGRAKTVENPDRTAIRYLRRTQVDRFIPLTADQASAILGKPARELRPEDIAGVYASARGLQRGVAIHSAETVRSLHVQSPIRQRVERAIEEMRAYLAAHRMQVFRTRDMFDYAFVRGVHCQTAGGFGGRVELYRLDDFDGDGAPDLEVGYRFGSGVVRSSTTIILNPDRRLVAFRVHGVPFKKKARWWVTRMFNRKTRHGAAPATAELIFANGRITVRWPRGTRPEAQWPVATEIPWTPNSAIRTVAPNPPARRPAPRVYNRLEAESPRIEKK